MTSFRDSSDSTEIRNLFKLLNNNEIAIHVWQTHFHQRQMANATIKMIEQDHLFLNLTNKLDLIPERHIYFYCEFKKIVFKISHYHLKDNSLKLSIPKEITLEELRSEKRFNLSHSKNTSVEFEKESVNEKTFSGRLFDLSSNGMSFLLSAKNKDTLAIDDQVILHKIVHNQSKDTINLTGKVRHVIPYSSKTDLVKVPSFKIGVQLSQSLDLESLHVFRQLLFQ